MLPGQGHVFAETVTGNAWQPNLKTLASTGIIAEWGRAGGDNRTWRRRTLWIGLFCLSAAVGALLPLMFGETGSR